MFLMFLMMIPGPEKADRPAPLIPITPSRRRQKRLPGAWCGRLHTGYANVSSLDGWRAEEVGGPGVSRDHIKSGGKDPSQEWY